MIQSGDFLDHIVERLKAVEPSHWGDITILLPGRRAGRKLTEALTREAAPGHWLPHITTLGEWSADQLSVHVPNKVELLVELQQVAEGMRGAHRLPEWGSFDRFQPWGLAALADFNAVDHHLLDPRQVFRDLRNIKDIEAWSFGRPDLTAGQQAFLEQWNTLHPLHTAFHNTLEKQGTCTSGMLARRMATEEGALQHVTGPVWMAGANALTPAERKTVDRLIQSGHGEWIWDTDRSYVTEGLEAGRFVREIVSREGRLRLPHPMADVTGPDKAKSRDWNLVTCSSRTMQTQYVREHLESLDAAALDRTAIILPSGDIAPMLLSSIPPGINKVNLTMGVPLDRTPLRHFLHLLFGLHGDKGRLHHSRLRGLLAHPLTRALQPEASKELKDITRLCTQQTLIRLSREDLAPFPKTSAILAPWWDGQQAASEGRDDGTTTVLSKVARWPVKKEWTKDPWLRATWMGFRDVVALHERSVTRTGTPPDLAETRTRMQRWMAQHAVDLAGEPLEGLQVMGLLESRGLDFDEIFVLDVNEGILPDGTPPPSFMPLDLQRSLSLPGRPERDGIFAAYLHRLLHRSRKVHLLCVGADLGDNGAEPSRFLGQLEAWANASLSGVKVKKSLWSAPLPGPAPTVPDLGWSSAANEAIDAMLIRGISPSALNQALTCERQFHYRYVLGLGEADTVEEHLEANTIGTVIHEAVEKGLETTVGHVLTKANLTALASGIRPRLVQALKENKKGAQADTGENVLVLRMAAAMVGRWVRDELREWPRNTEVTIVGLEEKLSRTFQLEDGRSIAFKGVADRVEVHRSPNGEVWQVIDYKTGKVEGKDLKLKSNWGEVLRKGQHGKALQLLLYAAMLRAKYPEANAIRSAIRAGRKGPGDNSSLLTLNWDGAQQLDAHHDDLLKDWLGEVVDDLLPSDEHDTVTHNEESTWCADCLTLE